MIKQKKTTTLIEAFEEFMLFKRASTLSEKTNFDYDQVIGFFLKHNELTGKEPITIITEQYILSWVVKMQDMDLKLSSINHYIGDIRVFCYWLMKRDFIKPFKINLLKGQQPNMRYFTDDEVAILVQKPPKDCNFTEFRTYVAICFVLATGARASTLINIKISDIDFTAREIIYAHLKNKKSMIVPLSPALASVLQEYLRIWSREKESGWLFCGTDESQCTVSALHQALWTYCDKRGIRSKGMHALRHSYSRRYIINGGNAFTLQKMLCHSTMEMTRRYVQLFSDDLKRDYEKISPLDNIFTSRGHISRK